MLHLDVDNYVLNNTILQTLLEILTLCAHNKLRILLFYMSLDHYQGSYGIFWHHFGEGYVCTCPQCKAHKLK